jgi:hypothetical protein
VMIDELYEGRQVAALEAEVAGLKAAYNKRQHSGTAFVEHAKQNGQSVESEDLAAATRVSCSIF